MLIPSSAKSSTVKEGEKFGLNSPCNIKPNLMFCLGLASPEAFLKSHTQMPFCQLQALLIRRFLYPGELIMM